MTKALSARDFLKNLQLALDTAARPVDLALRTLTAIEVNKLVDIVQKRIATLLERDKWTPAQSLELSALFFCAYLLTTSEDKDHG